MKLREREVRHKLRLKYRGKRGYVWLFGLAGRSRERPVLFQIQAAHHFHHRGLHKRLNARILGVTRRDVE